MRRGGLRVLALIVAAAALVGACGDDDTDVEQEAREATADARAAGQDAWASFRTDLERAVDEVDSLDDPKAKEELLESCRDTLESLRKAESAQADRVSAVCDRIRDTEADNRNSWEELKKEVAELNPAD